MILPSRKNGTKICTIRLGVAKVEGEFVDLSDGQDVLKVRIVSVETEPYKNLTEEHARWEGFSTLKELQDDLVKYYRKIDKDQAVTIIKFERVGGGLWQFFLGQNDFSVVQVRLIGVAYWEKPVGDELHIIGHGQISIYKTLFNAIHQKWPQI